MKECRLKIITANIIDDIDTPTIKYISQNQKSRSKNNEISEEPLNYIEEQILEQLEDKKNNEKKESNILNHIQLQELIRYNYISDNTNNINNNINNNLNIKEKNNINNNIEMNNLDINDLLTISNNNLKNNIINNNIINYNSIENHQNNIYNYNYSNNIESKKKEINSSIKNLFQYRGKKTNNMKKNSSSRINYFNKNRKK